MKKLLMLLMVCSGYELHAQLITYDNLAGRFLSNDSTWVKQGATIRYRIANINTFAKKVLIDGRMFSLATQIPAELASLFRIKAEAEQGLENTKKQVDKMEAVKDELATKGTEPPKALDKLVEDCKAYYQEALKIEEVLEAAETVTKTMADEIVCNETSMKKALQGRGVDIGVLEGFKNNLVAFKNAYYMAFNQYDTAARALWKPGDKLNVDKVKNAQDEVSESYDVLVNRYKDAIRKVDSLFNEATNPAQYMVTSQPIYVEDEADEVEFQTKIGNVREDLSTIKPYKTVLRVKGGLKIDYSVGLAFSFISDEQYYLDKANKLQKSNICNALTPGIAPMMHFYPKSGRSVAWGGMFGVNAGFKEITDINLGFLAGASVLFGRAKKLIFSTGISYTRVSRLKAGEYSVGDVYTDLNLDNVTSRVLRPAWFCSFSYSIAKRNGLKP